MAFLDYDLTLQLLKELKPIIEQVRRHNPSLADQMQRAGQSTFDVASLVDKPEKVHPVQLGALFHICSSTSLRDRAPGAKTRRPSGRWR